MARNISLAIGRPSTPSLGVRELVMDIAHTISLIAAAGRIGSAVDARQVPAQSDLKTAGLENAEILRAPYRF